MQRMAHMLEYLGLIGVGGLLRDRQARAERGNRVAQVMSDNGDEFLAQLCGLLFGAQHDLRCRHRLVIFELHRDKVREQLEHADPFRRVQPLGIWINRAERAKKSPVRRDDRNRDVAAKFVHLGRLVIAIGLVGLRVLNHYQ